MRRLLLEMFESTGQLDPQTIVLRMVVATIIAFFIYLSYKLSHEGSIYSKKFNVSLMALTVITTAVMIVIGNNIALSLGMVGALSIVRFRTAIKDSRDTIYIFWTIVAGICCGAVCFFGLCPRNPRPGSEPAGKLPSALLDLLSGLGGADAARAGICDPTAPDAAAPPTKKPAISTVQCGTQPEPYQNRTGSADRFA